jgi:TolB-like protein/Tfp pilus assembly protein PilF
MSFFSELKRRNVFRVGIAYLIGAWLLAQIADLLIDNIGAPDWVMKTLFVVLALGFFIALFFAWAFELTPDGVKRESEVDRSQSIANVTGRKLDRSIIVILLLALGYFAWDKFSTPPLPVQHQAAAIEEAGIDKSIAVLPFVNMSADADNEYFSDGLSEELLNLLAKVDGLKVAARTSSFKFKKSEADISEIGEQLHVAHVLEGSVRKSGNQARITAQLIKVDDGFHMWSETYDRDLDNIFEVQDEIAKAIVDALKLPLLGHDAKPLTSTTVTDNFAAYDLYLLGRHHARAFTEEGYRRANDYYLKALEIDPSFAAAYSGLADAYIFLADFGNLPMGEANQLARTAAEKALAIDPDSPEAHASMGLLLNNITQERVAETHFLKALQVNPNYVDAMLWYRTSLNAQLRVTEAMRITDRAMNTDPLSYSVRRAVADELIWMQRTDESLKVIQEFLAANPEDPTPYEIWGDLFHRIGLPQNAIPMYRNAHRLRPGDIYMAFRNVESGLQLDDENLVAHWLKEARARGDDAQWTRRAEREIAYATGDFSGLLVLVEQMLETSPGLIAFQNLRAIALMNLGEIDAARETLRQALETTGYLDGQPLIGSELRNAIQLANVLDLDGNADARDALLASIDDVLKRIHQSEPPTVTASYIGAGVASVRNDLPGVLRELEAAIDAGFRSHWDLLRDPVFKRWQDNPDFIAFHQGMLEAAARMRREYYVNNPAEAPVAATEGTN